VNQGAVLATKSMSERAHTGIGPAHLQAYLRALERGPLAPDLYDETKRRLGAVESVPRRALQ
jgi:hypothetical protein